MSFDKEFKSGIQKVKSAASQMIKNNMTFSCQIVDITIPNPDDATETLYPTVQKITDWFDSLFTNELKYKPINAKALEQMKLKGLSPPIQPSEIALVVIVPSDEEIVVGVSFPKTQTVNIEEFVKTSAKNLSPSYTLTNVPLDETSKINVIYVTYPCDSPLKEKDVTMREFFKQFKIYGIYVEVEDDDEYVNYLEGSTD